MSMSKSTDDTATIEPMTACARPLPPAPPAAGSVDQGALDRWLVELAGSFVGHDKAVARSPLKTHDGKVLVAGGEVVRSIAGERLATSESVLQLYKRLRAPSRFALVTVEGAEENTVRTHVAASAGQSTFLASASKLVKGERANQFQLARLPFRTMRGLHQFAKHSAQWLSNGTHGAGLRLGAVRPGWLYHVLGLRSGDLVRTVNDVPYGSAGQLQRALYTASLAASADQVSVELTRDGRHVAINYQFVGPSYRSPTKQRCP